ncbi:MAG: DUF4373 domain-containing protein [Rikenellaceae bacterium]
MKETFFFSHDFNARNDPKLQNVLMDHGCEGLGIYWCIIEQMYEQGGMLSLTSCKSIAFALHVSTEKVQSIVNDSELFQNDGILFWSESVKKRMTKREEVTEKRKQAADKRWGKEPKIAESDTSETEECKCNANAMQDYAIKVKSSKVKDIKENNNKEKEKSSVVDAQAQSFTLHPFFLERFNKFYKHIETNYPALLGFTIPLSQESFNKIYLHMCRDCLDPKKRHTLMKEVAREMANKYEAIKNRTSFEITFDSFMAQKIKINTNENFNLALFEDGTAKLIPKTTPPTTL